MGWASGGISEGQHDFGVFTSSGCAQAGVGWLRWEGVLGPGVPSPAWGGGSWGGTSPGPDGRPPTGCLGGNDGVADGRSND